MARKKPALTAIAATALAFALSVGSSAAPALADATPATSPALAAPAQVAQSGAFADVPTTHWAYAAVQQLAREGYIKGYPDGLFKGNRPMTRYEVAELVARADTAIRDAIAGGQQVKPSDIAALRSLLNEFGTEVKDIRSRVAALEAKTTALQKQTTDLRAEANATRLAVQRAHFVFNMLDRPGTVDTNFQVLNGPTTVAGTAPYNYLAATNVTNTSRGTAYSWGSGNINSNVPGVTGNGVQYWFARVAFVGQIDHGWSYGARFTTGGIHQENANGTTTGTGFCTNISTSNCSYDNLSGTQGSIPAVLEYADTQWTSPGGFYLVFGKFPVSEGDKVINPVGQIFAGQNISGGAVGYHDPNGDLQAQVIYGYSGVSPTTLATVNASAPVCAANVVGLNRTFVPGAAYSFADFNPNCNEATTEIGSSAEYYFRGSRTAFGLAEDHFSQDTEPLWDPAAVSCAVGASTYAAATPSLCLQNGGRVTTVAGGAGNYFTGQANVGIWTAHLVQFFGPRDRPTMQFGISYGSRMGRDPFTNATWVGDHSLVAALTYASKGNITFTPPVPFIPGIGTAGSDVFQLAFQQFGQNDLFGIDSGATHGTPTPTNNLGFQGLNGLRVYELQYAHWFTNNFRAGFNAFHVQNIPGVGLSIGAAGNGAVNPCPGCTGTISVNAVNLETDLQL